MTLLGLRKYCRTCRLQDQMLSFNPFPIKKILYWMEEVSVPIKYVKQLTRSKPESIHPVVHKIYLIFVTCV